jgi:hypothetical protein
MRNVAKFRIHPNLDKVTNPDQRWQWLFLKYKKMLDFSSQPLWRILYQYLNFGVRFLLKFLIRYIDEHVHVHEETENVVTTSSHSMKMRQFPLQTKNIRDLQKMPTCKMYSTYFYVSRKCTRYSSNSSEVLKINLVRSKT